MLGLIIGLIAAQDPFPTPGVINPDLPASENCYLLLSAQPTYVDIKDGDTVRARELLSTLGKLRQFKLDVIESGMIEFLERARPHSELSALYMLDLADEIVFDLPISKCLHLGKDENGKLVLRTYVLFSSGPPIQPITRFRKLRKARTPLRNASDTRISN